MKLTLDQLFVCAFNPKKREIRVQNGHRYTLEYLKIWSANILSCPKKDHDGRSPKAEIEIHGHPLALVARCTDWRCNHVHHISYPTIEHDT